MQNMNLTGNPIDFTSSLQDQIAGVFAKWNYSVDWLSEDINTISSAHEYSFPSICNGLLREFTLAETEINTSNYIKLYIQSCMGNNSILINNNMPLKLRI
jgi:hypothetical protein